MNFHFATALTPAIAMCATLLTFAAPVAHSQPSINDVMEQTYNWRKRQLQAMDNYVRRVDRGTGIFTASSEDNGPCASFANCDVFRIDDDGNEVPLSPTEVAVLAGVSPSVQALDLIGDGMLFAQGQITGLFRDFIGPNELNRAGVPEWLDPTRLVGRGGIMAVAAADTLAAAEESLQTAESRAAADAARAAAFLNQFQHAGTDSVNGTDALKYRTPDPLPPAIAAQFSSEDGSLSSGEMWFDPVGNQFLKQRMVGTANVDGETRDFFIEIEYSDFRNPPGCGDLIEPYRKTMRMGGMLSEEEQEEMEEARAQMAEFERELAAMPAQQRQMMERMMGSQMETMRALVDNGAMENSEVVEEIICNANLASLFGNAMTEVTDTDPDLVRQIQEHLVALGYEPGNTDGELDDRTVTAIIRFQADQGLPVTGQPTRELAARLEELVAG